MPESGHAQADVTKGVVFWHGRCEPCVSGVTTGYKRRTCAERMSTVGIELEDLLVLMEKHFWETQPLHMFLKVSCP